MIIALGSSFSLLSSFSAAVAIINAAVSKTEIAV